MSTIKSVDSLKFEQMTEEERKSRGILGTLAGTCASVIKATRNGRKYSNTLWEKVFNNSIVKEYFLNGGVPGELGHPSDRTETDMSKIAIMMPNPPQKNKDGELVATFDILDTPNGRIAYTLAKYGYKLGISSRGSGETYMDENGNENVDPDSYGFEAFDLVLLPACESARLNLVTESYDTKVEAIINRGFKKAINEALEHADDDARKIMTETLQTLNLDYTTNTGVNNKSANTVIIEDADDDGDDIVRNLQKTLKENKDLSRQVKSLQEKLSVCYTKETQNDEALNESKTKLNQLTESLLQHEKEIKNLSEQISLRDSLILQFRKGQEKAKNEFNVLNQQLNESNSKIQSLNAQISQLNEKFEQSVSNNESTQKQLKEQVKELTKDSMIKKSEYNSKLTKQNELIEKYRSIAKTAVDKYIQSKAILLGVSASEITARLNENYSFNDIDRICESMKNYKLNVSSLPFDSTNNTKKSVKMTFSESVNEPINRTTSRNSVDDEPDEQLLGLANYMGV